MQKMFSTLSLVAPLNTTVLLQGETGTGKELVARTIHATAADRASGLSSTPRRWNHLPRPSSSTPRARLPAPSHRGSVGSSLHTAARSLSTKWR